MALQWIVPEGLPPTVGALMTTRAGGCSAAPWDSMNVGDAVGDDAAAVARNRARVEQATGARAVYLRQRHGAVVVRVGAADAGAPPPEADGSVTAEAGIACAVQVADCLPVLMWPRGGRAVGAAHAGWRGLAAGVVEATLASLCEAAACRAGDVCAWLGPCIGPRRFEVGADVHDAFGGGARFTAVAGASPPKWHADLAGLATDRLRRLGIGEVSGGRWCTVEDASRFYSFRRDGVTGRMVAAIWLRH